MTTRTVVTCDRCQKDQLTGAVVYHLRFCAAPNVGDVMVHRADKKFDICIACVEEVETMLKTPTSVLTSS